MHGKFDLFALGCDSSKGKSITGWPHIWGENTLIAEKIIYFVCNLEEKLTFSLSIRKQNIITWNMTQ